MNIELGTGWIRINVSSSLPAGPYISLRCLDVRTAEGLRALLDGGIASFVSFLWILVSSQVEVAGKSQSLYLLFHPRPEGHCRTVGLPVIPSALTSHCMKPEHLLDLDGGSPLYPCILSPCCLTLA